MKRQPSAHTCSTLLTVFHKQRDSVHSRGLQNLPRRLRHPSGTSRKFAEKVDCGLWCFVQKKRHWVLCSFDSIVSQCVSAWHLVSIFKEGCGKRCPSNYLHSLSFLCMGILTTVCSSIGALPAQRPLNTHQLAKELDLKLSAFHVGCHRSLLSSVFWRLRGLPIQWRHFAPQPKYNTCPSVGVKRTGFKRSLTYIFLLQKCLSHY